MDARHDKEGIMASAISVHQTPRPSDSALGEVVIYESEDGLSQVECRLDDGSLWLSQRLIAALFQKDVRTINEHLRNVFEEGELQPAATIRKFRIVQIEGRRRITRPVDHYNLDAILSVGYRVNSKRGTQFRIWATRTLRDHLVRGYTLNEQRLRERGFREIEQAVSLLGKTLTHNELLTEEGQAVFDVVQGYTSAWRLLLDFDEDRLANEPAVPRAPRSGLSLIEARGFIGNLCRSLATRHQATELFGRERNQQLAAILGAIEQTFDGRPLYPTAQARAAHLLYFVIKDHPFTDGNKRIGALLFLEYLQGNGLLLRDGGGARFASNAIVALALLIAESEPSHKGLIIRLVLNLLDD
jgi:prophage maintenance system killer protein